MGPDDVGTPLHRDMGVHVTRGVEPWRIFAQYMGREDGPTRGRDGNVHMADARLGMIAMVSHLPAMLPVAVGCALAFRIRQERRVAVGCQPWESVCCPERWGRQRQGGVPMLVWVGLGSRRLICVRGSSRFPSRITLRRQA